MQQQRKKEEQKSEHMTSESMVIVLHAATSAEASVVRGLLESAGIKSPAPTYTDPFPMQEPPEGFTGTEVLVAKSQEEDAKRIIESSQNQS